MCGKTHGEKRLWPNWRYIPGIWLQELRRTTKNGSQESRRVARHSNHTLPTRQHHTSANLFCGCTYSDSAWYYFVRQFRPRRLIQIFALVPNTDKETMFETWTVEHGRQNRMELFPHFNNRYKHLSPKELNASVTRKVINKAKWRCGGTHQKCSEVKWSEVKWSGGEDMKGA
jgi:hypothetical protein